MDIGELIATAKGAEQEPCYPKRIRALTNQGWDSSLIERGIADTVRVFESGAKSFVVYGEPQSGKTEFMIALSCKLIDMDYQTIFILMNDNVELESQNFRRFHRVRELTVTPVQDFQILKMPISELKGEKQRLIFCRKNSKNLEKLVNACRFMKKRIVIDDEADYATPNSRINKNEVTRINEWVGELGDLTRLSGNKEIKGGGAYIGVTATPARLDLNNTFFTDSRKWVFLDSHKDYKGRAFFFPVTKEDRGNSDYNLVRLPDEGDNPKLLRHAVFRFMTRAAILNLIGSPESTPYSMLIHTAGKVHDHEADEKAIQKIMTLLGDENASGHTKYCEELAEIIMKLLIEHNSSCTVQDVFTFIFQHRRGYEILVINHKNDSENVKKACEPNALFTFAIGGNIVSRGLTFERLLTFYFSRNVKGRLQQNTYIQRARMFGNRPYSRYFELCVPDQLYSDWADCFNDHEISLRLAKAGFYQHVQTGKTSVVDTAARDNANVTVEKSERSVGDIFKLTTEIEERLINHDRAKPLSTLKQLVKDGLLKDGHLPHALLNYVKEVCEDDESDVLIVFSKGGIQSISSYSDGDQATITRPRGGVIHAMLNKRPEYSENNHFFLPIKNDAGEARILYKSNVGHSILQNLKSYKAIST